ncbi:unnamed protein product [Medioppia subpectinata]|uniref:PX domain-containing protein n=1 Tax=Medioppia subpectinata TaxID=1979941 RepID=A0A7R9KUK0_9ACAR|nr:unnamed protein product [Medioppia subpectinata]CAG2110155.1 unnamed protein product [Medioppia subpectinata]
MHFSIADTQLIKDQNHSFVTYNISINGSFHCSLRYKQLYNFHDQLKRTFGANTLPLFPPKRLLPLTATQTEERRSQIEKYIQIISQDQRIVSSDLFNGFFLNGQQETQNTKKDEVILDVFQMNWQSIKVQILSTDRTDIVLDSVSKALELTPQLIPYFNLFVVKRVDNICIPIRKLQNFESPYLTLRTLNSVDSSHAIVIRKSYWDSIYDDDLFDDRTAVNILYFQTLHDIEKGLIQANKEIRRQLTSLQAKGSKTEYLQLSRTLKYYGYIQFEPCFCDFPQQNTRVLIAAGGKELNIRAYTAAAILMSVCLQGMVEELLMKRNGKKIKREEPALPTVSNGFGGTRRGSWSYMKRDGSSHQISLPRSVSTDAGLTNSGAELHNKPLKSSHSSHNGFPTKSRHFVENDAFNGIGDIGDDDL